MALSALAHPTTTLLSIGSVMRLALSIISLRESSFDLIELRSSVPVSGAGRHWRQSVMAL